MPNRIIRDWTDSAAFEGLSPEAERMFVRLLMKADDFGRFHANPRLVKAACFPLTEDLRANIVAAWLTELSDQQLIFCYEAGTGSFLAIRKFRQRTRAETSKFPSPNGEPANWLPPGDSQVTVNGRSTDGQATATRPSPAHGDGDGDGDGCEVEGVVLGARAPVSGAERPSEAEFLTFCEMHGGPVPWFARDKWLAAEADNWKGRDNWRAYAARCKTWWESDGRPMQPPKPKFAPAVAKKTAWDAHIDNL